MIELEYINTVGWEHAIRGLRNPLRSWDKNDSRWDADYINYDDSIPFQQYYTLGQNDLALAKKLIKAGASHRKFLRQITIYVDITANLKFWDEYDTYLHTVKNSTSQMHTLTKRDFTIKDFSDECMTARGRDHMKKTIQTLNILRKDYLSEPQEKVKKIIWRDMIEIMPQSFLYTRTTMLNYEVFLSQYAMRKQHKMTEWVEYCEELRYKLPYMNDFIKVLEEK